MKKFLMALLCLNIFTVPHAYASGFSSPDFKGIYKMHTIFGEKEFMDILVINKSPLSGSGLVSGSVTVPGVFTVPMSGYYLGVNIGRSVELNFTIRVDEGNGPQDYLYLSFPVNCSFASHCDHFIGEVYNDNQVVGQFEATRLKEVGREL